MKKKDSPLHVRRAHHVRIPFAVQHLESSLGKQRAHPCPCCSVLFYRHVPRAERWFKPCSGRQFREAKAQWGRPSMLYPPNNGSVTGKPCLATKAKFYVTKPLPSMSEVSESGAGKAAPIGSAGQAPAATGHRVFSPTAA